MPGAYARSRSFSMFRKSLTDILMKVTVIQSNDIFDHLVNFSAPFSLTVCTFADVEVIIIATNEREERMNRVRSGFSFVSTSTASRFHVGRYVPYYL
jgi:hypothetical protein